MKERKEVSSGGEPGRSGGGGFSHVFLVEEVIWGVTPIIPDRDLTQFREILFIVDFGSSRH